MRLRRHLAEIHNNLGLARRMKGHALQTPGRLDEAVAAYHDALRLNPADIDARGLLADALAEQRAFDQAILY